jgi:hypothetical protein
LRVARLELRPPSLGPERTRGVDEFLGGELQARVGHAAVQSAAQMATSKHGAFRLYGAQIGAAR